MTEGWRELASGERGLKLDGEIGPAGPPKGGPPKGTGGPKGPGGPGGGRRLGAKAAATGIGREMSEAVRLTGSRSPLLIGRVGLRSGRPRRRLAGVSTWLGGWE